ncbi:MAG: recombinase RecT [Pseudomonadales bacterium]|jgi:recombination protein RecT|nr:recombinase RecT [Pseudomonadales bacterium]
MNWRVRTWLDGRFDHEEIVADVEAAARAWAAEAGRDGDQFQALVMHVSIVEERIDGRVERGRIAWTYRRLEGAVLVDHRIPFADTPPIRPGGQRMQQNAIELRRQVERMTPELARVAPPGVPADLFARIAVSALQRTPELAQCEVQSVLDTVMRSAETGLPIDGRNAAAVVYRTKGGPSKAQFIPMVQGSLRLAYASGQVAAIHAAVVHKADRFVYRFEMGEPVLEHEPTLTRKRGDIIAAYAVAKMTTGAVVVEVLPREHLEKLRESSKAKSSGPWATWFARMCEKSAIQALCRRLPVGAQAVVRGSTGSPAAAPSEKLQTPASTTPAEYMQTTPAASLEAPADVDYDTGEILGPVDDFDADGPIPGLDDLDDAAEEGGR